MSSMSLALSLLLLLQTGSAPAGGGGAAQNQTGMGMNDILVLGAAMVGIMYFVVIRPANRERKKQSTMMAALKKGDRILLSCGLVGTVAAMTEREVLVKVDDKNPLRMRFQKQSIQTILSSDDPVPAEVAEAEAK
jgi:preprotein translocase subunit YajC